MPRASLSLRFYALALFLAGSALVMLTLAVGAKEAARGETLYQQKCAMCHLKDGSGAKAMKLADLRSNEVQKKSDAQLREIVAKGKKPMPGFENQLNKQQIDDLVAYMRELAKKKN